MTTEKLFGGLCSKVHRAVDELTNDRTFAGYVTLWIEDEHGEMWVAAVKCQHNTDPELEEPRRVRDRVCIETQECGNAGAM